MVALRIPSVAARRAAVCAHAASRANPARPRAAGALVLTVVTALLAAAPPAAALLPAVAPSADALYQRECGVCHGPAGHGDGSEAPTFLTPPRDLQAELVAKYPPDRVAARIRQSRTRELEIDLDVVEERRKRMSEEIAGHLQRLPDVDWPRARRGADVYAERCETCHGPLARPVTPTALQKADPRPSATAPRPDFQKALGDDEILKSVRGGHPELAGFTPVASDEDARALLVYLRLLSAGFARYSLWCAGCHGDEGRADGPFATSIDRPEVVLDRAWLQAQSPAELRRKIMHLMSEDDGMLPHYQRELSVEQARALAGVLAAMAPAAPPSHAAPAPSPAPPAPAQPAAATSPARAAASPTTAPAARSTATASPRAR